MLAAPSVPSAMLTPASASFATGAKPLASLRFDDGQCATEQPWRASSAISSGSRCTACTAIRFGVTRFSRAQALERPHAVLGERALDLVLGLVQMHVHRQVELGGERRDLAEASRPTTV